MHILAKGNSMLPTLEDGKLYEIELVRENLIEVGDIIVYRWNQVVICHRVVRVLLTKNQSIFFETKGDNCNMPDPYVVTGEMVIGKVLA